MDIGAHRVKVIPLKQNLHRDFSRTLPIGCLYYRNLYQSVTLSIKPFISFRNKFPLCYRKLNFEIKLGVPMLVQEQLQLVYKQ